MTESNTPAKRGTEKIPVPGLPADWDRMATEKLVGVVDQVKVKSSKPAIKVARTSVFGILLALFGIIALFVFLIGLVRALESLVGLFLDDGVWLVYLVLGAIFSLVGLVLWSKRPKGAAS